MSSPGVHTADNWPDLLEVGFYKIYEDAAALEESMMVGSKLFSSSTSSKNSEKDSSAGALGDLEEFEGTIGYDDSAQGYDRHYYFTQYAKGIKITRDLYDDDLYGIMSRRPKQLGQAVIRTREKLQAQLFNEAFTTEPSATDGGPLDSSGNPTELCASDQCNSGDGATQSNEGTSAFSPTAVEATRQLMIGFRGDISEVISVNPDEIIIPLALEEQAYEYINAKGKVNVATNNPNFLEGRYTVAVWPNFLTSTKNWFMVDSRLMKEYLKWWDRVKPEFFQDKDSDTLVAKYCTYTRWGKGWSHWIWIYGHKPA